MIFKIRCSAIGQIMTDPRSKADKEAGNLSETSKTFCKTWLKEQLFKRRKEIDNKYLTKGIEVENESIDYLIEHSDFPFALKNDEYFESDFITGTPDLILKDKVIDIKSSWDVFSFPLFEDEIDKNYWWQLQGYMYLTLKDNAELTYVLIDTPSHLIEKEVYYKSKDIEFLTSSDAVKFESEMFHKMTFDDIASKYRIKTFKFKKDIEAIEKIKTRVSQCQKYIDELLIKIELIKQL